MGHHLRRFISWTLLLALSLSTAAAPAFAEESTPTEYAAATDACTLEIAANGSGENAAVVGENTEPPLEEDPADEQTPPEQEPVTEPEQPAEDPGESSEPPATDPSVIATTWTSAHVRYLGGYEDRSVRPERQVTRAEAAAIVYRLLEDPEAGIGSCSYADVKDSDWFAINVRALCRLGLFDDGIAFRPNEPITRAEMVDLLTRLAPETAVTVSFSDVPADYWAAEQIGIAASLGWVGGYEDGTFRPENGLTRAEACSIINRVTGRYGDTAQAQRLMGLGLYTDMTASHWAAITVAEASVAHENVGSCAAETWSGVALGSYTFMPGVHEISGQLYSVDRYGKLALNKNVGAYWADANGVLTQTASSYQQSYVPYISQIDEIYAWMGCEPISALMGLKTLGYAQNVTPTAFLNALPITNSDPAKGFVGSPYHSDGRYSSIDPAPLADFCNSYTNGADVCEVFNGKSVTDVQRELLAGNMIVAWQTFSWAPVRYGNFLINGTYQARVANNHVRLICGYDPARGYFVSDPYNLQNRGQIYQYWVSAQSFESCWNERKMGMVMR